MSETRNVINDEDMLFQVNDFCELPQALPAPEAPQRTPKPTLLLSRPLVNSGAVKHGADSPDGVNFKHLDTQSSRNPANEPAKDHEGLEGRAGLGEPCCGMPMQQQPRCEPCRDVKMFHVEIDRQREADGNEPGRLGLDARPLLSEVVAALSVVKVQPGGLVDKWNQSCRAKAAGSTGGGAAATPERRHRVRKGDYIVEVNGFRESIEGMLNIITQESSLRLLIMRFPSLHHTNRLCHVASGDSTMMGSEDGAEFEHLNTQGSWNSVKELATDHEGPEETYAPP